MACASDVFVVPSSETPTLAFALDPSVSPVQAGDTIELASGSPILGVYEVRVRDLTIRSAAGMRATLDGDGDGPILVVPEAGSGLVIEGIDLRNAVSTGDGGAVRVGGPGFDTATFAAVDCGFFDNGSGDDGGAVYVGSLDQASFTGCVFEDNRTLPPVGGKDGGAIAVEGGGVTVRDSVFRRNDAINFGGAIALIGADGLVERCVIEDNEGSQGGGVGLQQNSGLIMRDSRIVSNDAGSVGGGVLITGSNDLTLLERCLIDGNTSAGTGGGLVLTLCTSEVRQCVIVNNTAQIDGGISTDTRFCGPLVVGCTIIGNQSASGAGGVGGDDETVVESCIVRGNSSPQVSMSVAPYSNIESGLATDPTVIDADPLFVDAASGDYRLTALSPCIDAGDATRYSTSSVEPFDFDSLPRLVDDLPTPDTGLTLVGLAVDIGAHEFQDPPRPACPADQNFDGELTPADFTAWIINFNAGCD
ncbi:MAG: right-handed parallel beta-helix repeat-containing protein [Planctomycetota bacterium]